MLQPVEPAERRVNPTLDRLAAIAWRLIVIAVVVLAALWLMRQARVVFFPIVIAVFLCRALSPVVRLADPTRMARRTGSTDHAPRVLRGADGLMALLVPSFADEIGSIGPTLTTAIDDVEDWLVEDSPIEVSRASIDRLRERAGEEADNMLRSSDGDLTDRATLVAEFITGSVLAVILTFFMLRDGRRFVDWVCDRVKAANRPPLRRSLDAAWSTLAGYLRGATLLGGVESIVIGLTLWISGGSLVAPVMIVTFLGAYIPLIGAVITGSIAVLVALVTGGIGAAIAVAVVALIVQQFDNDLLAPIIYGRALHLHPVVILLSVVTGGALFGIVGTVLSVPVVAVGVNATKAFRLEPT